MKYRIPILFIICCLTTLSSAQIINVPGDHSTIQAAINAANNGDTIIIAEGTYLENIKYNAKNVIIASEYILDGESTHIEKTIIDGSQPVKPDSGSVVTFCGGVDSTAVLCGLTITGGTGTKDEHGSFGLWRSGGGIYLVGDGGGKIEHCIIRDNHLVNDYHQWGGGIAAFQGGAAKYDNSIIIQNNIIRNNSLTYNGTASAPSGAGIKIGIGDSLKYAAVIIQDNIIDSNLVRNTHPSGGAVGGGINFGMIMPSPPGEYILNNNIIAHNKVEAASFTQGGGIIVIHINVLESYYEDQRPTPLIYNNLIYGNESSGYGGAIAVTTTIKTEKFDFLRVPQPVIMNNTIVDNKAKQGVGLYCYNAKPILMNNIFANDLSYSGGTTELLKVGQVPNFIYYNLISDGVITDKNNEGNISGDPYLTEDYCLSDSSPCINAGIASILIDWSTPVATLYTAPAFDYYYKPRPNPFDNQVDISACEWYDIFPPTLTLEKDSLCCDSINSCNVTAICTEEGYAFLVPENTEKELTAIRKAKLQDSITVNDIEVIFTIANPENGTFWVYTVDISGNVSEPDTLVIGCVAINHKNVDIFNIFFNIFPNPANTIITLELASPVQGEIEISNLNGQLLYRKPIQSTTEQINISSFSKGVYFVTVRSKEFVRTEKVVKL